MLTGRPRRFVADPLHNPSFHADARAAFNVLFAAESNAAAAADDKLIKHRVVSVDQQPMPEFEKSRSGVKRTALTCLFITKAGGCSVRVLQRPVPQRIDEGTQIPPSVIRAGWPIDLHDCRSRVYKRTVDGCIPVFEEED
jgi:hypothetical protein